jgi:protein-disulfide isomerase
MSSSSRPNVLRALLLTVPAVAALALLMLIGRSAVQPGTVAAAQAVPTGPAAAPTPTGPPKAGDATGTTAPAQAAAAAAPAGATKAAEPAAFTPEQKQAIEKIIKSYLVANPEVFLEVQTALEEKMEKDQAQKFKVAITENAAEIYRQPNSAIAGNANGDITVVEFFDYNCGYCKRGLHDVVKLVESDPKVRLVFKELPILSKGSQEASHVALAARQQGKYWEVHRALLSAKGHVDEASALKIVEGLNIGLDMDKLKKDMAAPEVTAEIEHSEALAKKLGVNGTPHFLVGDRAIPGAPDDLYDQLSHHVTDMRKQGCAYC